METYTDPTDEWVIIPTASPLDSPLLPVRTSRRMADASCWITVAFNAVVPSLKAPILNTQYY